MTRPYNERRNRQIVVLIERRIPPKEVAKRLGITWVNVRKIASLWRKGQFSSTGGLDEKTYRKRSSW